MKRFKAAVRFFTSFILAAALLCSAASAAAAPDTDRLYKGSFKLYSFEGETDMPFYFSDSFFTKSGKTSDVHLRTMSSVLAFAAQFSEDSKEPDKNIRDVLIDIGCVDEEINFKNMTVTSPNTIGSAIAHKFIGGVPLIIVAIRGNQYKEEWASNFTAGEEGDPEGFSEAASKVLARIKQYREFAHISGKAKYWVTGYSRAGAVANLVGRTLNEESEAYNTTADDLYVYTFEAPNCSADDTQYENIHNVADCNDIVPCVFPEDWGISRNGVAEPIGDEDDSVMAKSFDMAAEGFTTDVWKVKKKVFLKQFTTFLSDNISRKTYVNLMQEPLCALSQIVLSKGEVDFNDLMDFVDEVWQSATQDSGMVWILLKVFSAPESENTIKSVTEFIAKHMDKVYDESDTFLTEEEYETLKESIKPLVNVLLLLVTPELYCTQDDGDGNELKLPFYHLLTFFNNASEFIDPHYGSSVFSLLIAEDDHYKEGFTVPPGDVYYGETKQSDGENAAQRAKALGFSDSDIVYLQNGYDISLITEDVTLRENEADEEVLKALRSSKSQSERLDSYHSITLTKQIGFRSLPAEAPFAENTVSVSVEDDQTEKRTYSVLCCDGKAVRRITPQTEFQDGVARLTFEAPESGVYAVAFSSQTTVKEAGFEIFTVIGFALIALLWLIAAIILVRRLRRNRKK